MDLTKIGIIIFGLFMVWTFCGMPIITAHKVKINFTDPDNPLAKKLRAKRIDLDLKFNIFHGLNGVKASLDELVTHKNFYDYVINHLRITDASKLVISESLHSFREVSNYMKKGRSFYEWKFFTNGNDKLKTLHALLDKHIKWFNELYELETELKKIRINYEEATHEKVD